jgi:hypothetical protein
VSDTSDAQSKALIAPDGPPLDETVAYPRLSEQQLTRLRAYGSPEPVEVGEELFSGGDAS